MIHSVGMNRKTINVCEATKSYDHIHIVSIHTLIHILIRTHTKSPTYGVRAFIPHSHAYRSIFAISVIYGITSYFVVSLFTAIFRPPLYDILFNPSFPTHGKHHIINANNTTETEMVYVRWKVLS